MLTTHSLLPADCLQLTAGLLNISTGYWLQVRRLAEEGDWMMRLDKLLLEATLAVSSTS